MDALKGYRLHRILSKRCGNGNDIGITDADVVCATRRPLEKGFVIFNGFLICPRETILDAYQVDP